MDTKAYSFPIGPEIDPNSNSDSNLDLQTSPAWVLTFVRWENRDSIRNSSQSSTKVRPPLVVRNDCISISTTTQKGQLTPSMSATLLITDVNYGTAISPGDFVFVNILNWEKDADRVAKQASNLSAINGINDGFKGVFKVQGVRKTINIDPNTGTKTVVARIDGFAFTEFNNTIYFNPNLILPKNQSNIALYVADVAAAWANMVSTEGPPALQDLIAKLIQTFIGTRNSTSVAGLVVSPNTHFEVPLSVGTLLGLSGNPKIDPEFLGRVVAAKDVYRYLFGIQEYSAGSSTDLATGMNPIGLKQKYPGFYYTKKYCPGHSLLKPEYWNQVKLWSIINQYTNQPLNEIYSCFRVSPSGSVMPTIVFRQIPFTNEDFTKQKFGTQDGTAASIPVTKFLNLPRWKLSPAMVYSLDIGREEAARINFVQFYAKSNLNSKGVEISDETARHNYVFDDKDVKRSGLRPYVINNSFDSLPSETAFRSPIWARILGDALIGGHLKLNGTITSVGIAEPIAIGDNLEFDGTVFHIESVVHQASINLQLGVRTFRTTVSISNGIDAQSSESGLAYAEMATPNAYDDRERDWANNQILPGVSDSQGTESARNDGLGSAAFPQPKPDYKPQSKKKGRK